MKSTWLILLFCLPIAFSSALNFGISPDRIVINGSTGEELCNSFELISDSDILFSGQVLWSEKNTRNIADYNIDSNTIGISAKYPLNSFHGENTLCLKTNSPGKYYGALLYKISDSNYGVGTWIELDIEGTSILEKFQKTITGKAINKTNLENIQLSIIFCLLLIILVLTLRRIAKK